MELKGTRTEKNLLASFAGESQARNRYTFYASIAKKEGYVQISRVFEETAGHEKEHAERFFKHLKEGNAAPELEITAAYPANALGTTLENLRSAAAGEKHEFTELYPEFAKIAEEEGFTSVAHTWRMVMRSEEWHHERFTSLVELVESGRLFKREEKVAWVCQNCGYIHIGEEPPAKCPACQHDKGYFKLHVKDF